MRSCSAWDWLCLGTSSLIFSPFLGAVCVLGVAGRALWVKTRNLMGKEPNFRWESGKLWILGLLTVILGFSTALAVHPTEAALGLFHFIPYFFVFAGLQMLLTTPERLQKLAWILVLTALPVSVIGLGQLYWGWSGPIFFEPLIHWELTGGGNPPGRMASVFAYANVLADYAVMIWALAIGLMAEQWQRLGSKTSVQGQFPTAQSPDRQFYPWLGDPKLLLALLGLILMATSTILILCNSRNAWGIALLMGLIYALYWGWRWILAGFSVILLFSTGAAFAPPPAQAPLRLIVPQFIWARLNDQLYPDRPSGQLRRTQWQFAWDMALQRPWTGWGLRSFSELYEHKSGLRLGHPHNFYLMTAAETGFITTLLLLGFVGWILVELLQRLAQLPYRTFPQQMQVMYLIAFLGTSLFHILDVPLFDLRINLLGWILLAGLAGQGGSTQFLRRDTNPQPPDD